MAKYYTGRAMLAEVSLRGSSYGLSDAMNEAVYGRGVSMDDVLACAVAPPLEFGRLNTLLNSWGGGGGDAADRSVRGARILRPLAKSRSFSAKSDESASIPDVGPGGDPGGRVSLSGRSDEEEGAPPSGAALV